jgi:hypothetical protein
MVRVVVVVLGVTTHSVRFTCATRFTRLGALVWPLT